MNTLGERLRIARDKKGLKQTQVKERTNINNKTLSGYENNVSQPDGETLVTLAELYEVTFEWLLTGKGEMSSASSSKREFQLSDKDERDISKRIKKMKKDIIEGSRDEQGLNYMGEPMSSEAVESLLEALEHAERIATLANKKYIPKKYRDE
ncbi:helix-turn-helix domain-containing protein [Mammaliicoccus sciuri]